MEYASMVDVILLERVEKLGQMGQVVKVRPGFARNYLLPQKKAMRATKENMAYFETQRAQLEANDLQRKSEASEVSTKLEGLTVVLIRQAGESGQLYGSVMARDISDAVTAAGFTVERRQIVLDRPIKTLGMHRVRVMLHPEVGVTVTANVAQSKDAARLQAAGIDPLARRAGPAARAATARAGARRRRTLRLTGPHLAHRARRVERGRQSARY
jgi:large subunit ribosomal protein L9